MTMTLPKVLTQYFAAASRFDSDTAADCFTPDAVVHDEEREHVGRDAIREWIEEAMARYHAAAEPLRADGDGSRGHLVARVSGDFPGSPVELDFAFTLRDDHIASLIIE